MPGPKPTHGKASLRHVWSNSVAMFQYQMGREDEVTGEVSGLWRCLCGTCACMTLLSLFYPKFVSAVSQNSNSLGFLYRLPRKTGTELPAVQEGSLTIRKKKVNIRMDNA